MGHLYPEQQSKFIETYLKQHKHGSLMEIMYYAWAEDNQEVSCAEGAYTDFYMFEMAYGISLHYYLLNEYIEPARKLSNEKEIVVMKWVNSERLSKKEKRVFTKIPFRLTGKEIKHLDYVCM